MKAIKILFLKSHLNSSIKSYFQGTSTSSSLWGMIQLSSKFEVITKNAKNFISRTFCFLFNHFDVLYIWSYLPKANPPYMLLKLLPSCRHKKVIVLFHSHPYGKGRNIEDLGKVRKLLLEFWCKGIDRALFFSPLSMMETITAGLFPREKCVLIHWGGDLKYYNPYMDKISDEGYWVHTGKEMRDWNTIDAVELILRKRGTTSLKVIRERVSYAECLRLELKASGVIIIPNDKGLTYCTGLTCIMTALSLGKPIVAVRNPYWPFDLEAMGVGIYVRPHHPDDVVKAIDRIDHDPALKKSIQQNAFQLAKKYNMECFGAELEAIIHELCN